jgi:hypothetical protein
MSHRLIVAALPLLLAAAVALAQQPAAPVPLYPGAASSSIASEPLPPPAPAVEPAGAAQSPAPPQLPPPAAPAIATSPSSPTGRVFCEQPVTVQLADRDEIPERYRPFIGIWSDASWTPQLCAALVVSNVAPDGTASIVYLFGPMGAGGRGASGILHGTGIVRDGELKFQNADGSQFLFRPLYADLDGQFTTPQGQNYRAVFKKTP